MEKIGTQYSRGLGRVIDVCSVIRQLKWAIKQNIAPEELPSIFVHHLLTFKRQGQVTFGTPNSIENHSRKSFAAADILPLPLAAFLPAVPVTSSRGLQPPCTYLDSITAGVSHTRSNVHAYDLKNFDVEPRSVVFPSPLLGSSGSGSDDLLHAMRMCSVLPSCALVVPWEMTGELNARAEHAACVYIPNVKPGMTMAIGERWWDTVRMTCGDIGGASAAGDTSERIGTISARRMLELRLEGRDSIHEISIQGAKHVGDGFLRTLADLSQQKCIRNVSHVKKRWFDVHYAVQCVTLGETRATAAIEEEMKKRNEDDEDDDDDDDGGDNDDADDDHRSKISLQSASSASTAALPVEVQALGSAWSRAVVLLKQFLGIRVRVNDVIVKVICCVSFQKHLHEFCCRKHCVFVA
jgi:hypothetical protein